MRTAWCSPRPRRPRRNEPPAAARRRGGRTGADGPGPRARRGGACGGADSARSVIRPRRFGRGRGEPAPLREHHHHPERPSPGQRRAPAPNPGCDPPPLQLRGLLRCRNRRGGVGRSRARRLLHPGGGTALRHAVRLPRTRTGGRRRHPRHRRPREQQSARPQPNRARARHGPRTAVERRVSDRERGYAHSPGRRVSLGLPRRVRRGRRAAARGHGDHLRRE